MIRTLIIELDLELAPEVEARVAISVGNVLADAAVRATKVGHQFDGALLGHGFRNEPMAHGNGTITVESANGPRIEIGRWELS